MCPDGLERTSCTLMTRHGIVDIDAISGTLCDSVQARLKTYTTRTPGLHVSQPRLQTLEKGQTAVAAGAQRAMQLVALQQLASGINQQ
jgi:hypothetical protein